ncbi:MAG: pitrilysin family protein [Schleiferiaceae bacterium]
MQIFTFTLPNGIRVVHKQIDGPVAHCGITVNAGSRDEKSDEQGLAHYIEHTFFKGTQKRKVYHILSRLEDVGGELNAYTSKEETVVYGSFLAPHYERAIELIFDICFHSTFPEKEIKKEKDVIFEEINSYLDSPSDSIFDEFDELIFPEHAMGKNILGTEQSLASFSRQSILDFIRRNYTTDQMVFSSVGRIAPKKLERLLNKYSSDIPQTQKGEGRQQISGYTPVHKSVERDTYQTHLVIGNRAPSAVDEDLTGMILLNNLMGGPGMNSRLNLNIREKYGFAYNIESYYQAYSDTGVFGIYAGVDPSTAAKTTRLIKSELKKMREKSLGVLQLSRAKQQLKGQIALNQENYGSQMLGMAKSTLVFGKMDTLEEVHRKIDSLTSSQLLEIANKYWNEQEMSTLIYKAKG